MLVSDLLGSQQLHVLHRTREFNLSAGTTLLPDAPGRAPHWAAVVTNGELSAGSQANPPSPVLEGDLLIEVRRWACATWATTRGVPALPRTVDHGSD